MISLRDFLTSIGQTPPGVSIRAVAQQCQTESPISLRALIQGGCKRTIAVLLERQMVFEGNVPYLGTLNVSGVLQEIAVPATTAISEVRFVKAGRDTSECNDSEAVVIVPVAVKSDQSRLLKSLVNLRRNRRLLLLPVLSHPQKFPLSSLM